ncbi:unnamed protein product [Porites lobata]|uniref:Thyroid transcription factor 1-associated protein 26 n=1 Tax=Porites lobata TaxID=104759 RepID=A0ABN8QGD0_9CNID|nr:unnamed protein product [Porites lobata]
MADEECLSKKTTTITKPRSKSKSHWRKPQNLLNVGNREKGHAFVEKRKKMALREYKKLLKKTRKEQELRKESGEKVQQTKPTLRTAEGRNDSDTISCSRPQVRLNNQDCLESSSQSVRKQHNQIKQKPVNVLIAAESEFKKRKLEKEKLIKEREVMIQKHREEVREKMRKRRETFGRLNKKTRRGQPVMANQIEHLLGKIQSKS